MPATVSQLPTRYPPRQFATLHFLYKHSRRQIGLPKQHYFRPGCVMPHVDGGVSHRPKGTRGEYIFAFLYVQTSAAS